MNRKRLTALPLQLLLVCLTMVLSLSITGFAATSPPVSDTAKTERLRLGERMYRDGILPSGASMPAFIRGDVVKRIDREQGLMEVDWDPDF